MVSFIQVSKTPYSLGFSVLVLVPGWGSIIVVGAYCLRKIDCQLEFGWQFVKTGFRHIVHCNTTERLKSLDDSFSQHLDTQCS